MQTIEGMTLLQAVGLYVETSKSKQNHESVHRELYRFIQWCGPERRFCDISPADIGEYADSVGGTGTTPQAAERLQVVRGFLSYAKKKGLTEQNLAQHVRIRKPRVRLNHNLAQDTPEIIELTPEGYAQLLNQLEELKAQRAPLALQIQKAAADKDVRENAPLEAAREQLGHLESRIREMEHQIKYSVVADPSHHGEVRAVKIGMRVTVQDLSSKRETTYSIVGRTEANPLEGKISDVSPMGKALVGRSPGQEVEVETPRGRTRYRIVGVQA